MIVRPPITPLKDEYTLSREEYLRKVLAREWISSPVILRDEEIYSLTFYSGNEYKSNITGKPVPSPSNTRYISCNLLSIESVISSMQGYKLLAIVSYSGEILYSLDGVEVLPVR